MAMSQKLVETFEHHEQLLHQLETSFAMQLQKTKKINALSHEAHGLRQDRARLADELEQVRNKATELVATSRNAVGKIDQAMSRIRSVLHSNGG